MVALKDNFGFLKSDRRKEEVYFHYSHVVFLEDQTDWNDDYTLAEGQDMEFLVVIEPDDGNATNGAGGGTASSGGERWKKCSARKVQFLEKGTVVFHQHYYYYYQTQPRRNIRTILFLSTTTTTTTITTTTITKTTIHTALNLFYQTASVLSYGASTVSNATS